MGFEYKNQLLFCNNIQHLLDKSYQFITASEIRGPMTRSEHQLKDPSKEPVSYINGHMAQPCKTPLAIKSTTQVKILQLKLFNLCFATEEFKNTNNV